MKKIFKKLGLIRTVAIYREEYYPVFSIEDDPIIEEKNCEISIFTLLSFYLFQFFFWISQELMSRGYYRGHKEEDDGNSD